MLEDKPGFILHIFLEKFVLFFFHNRYVFPKNLPMGLVNKFIRGRLPTLSPSESLYLFVGENVLVSVSTTVGEVASLYRDPDGFVYVSYATQETFGA